ncbi:MAG: tRNA (N6-isopentenyl adenosine(37)-C2)-methylthiotransferase MiaB [Actinomycetota bacterium]|nr:tRNA (N6-isopentenyl adenosine(37)-C2)-methylthiotransferase MiaB [Actinomycetota bacterium]MDA8281568.1 tRNA (N6-isopentenyl adenosine(37)-C2)-methylthiotransferase MiaB [Actinomycetota bacterium]
MTRKFMVRTFGCQMNEHDSERIAGLLVADGLEPTDDLDEADVVVLNTCCIRENADNKLYGHLGHLKSLRDRRPGLQIAVGGCLAQKDRDDLRRRAPHVDVVFGTHNVNRAAALLRQAAAHGPVVEVLDAPEPDGAPAPAAIRDLPYAAWVTIQTGCDNSCAFCIVPQVRGPEASRPVDDVVAEVAGLAATGVTEVTLLGQNVNSYGRDITGRAPLFAELLRAVGAVDGIQRVRFTSPHPKDLRPETVAAMAEVAAVCEHLHLPLQSGSDRVLATMRRGYRAGRYLERLGAARRAVPDLAVTTDIIVGFPGETEDDFADTLAVAAEAGYDSTYTFVFSPRPGTRAAAMVDDVVAPEVVAERFERLRVVVERSALVRHQARIGRIEEVLVEGPSARDELVWSGRTRQNKLVHVVGGPDRSGWPRPGAYATVEVLSAAPHFLRGRLVEVVAPPRHRVRVPIAVSAG